MAARLLRPPVRTGQAPARQLLRGWGGTAPVSARVVQPRTAGEIADLLAARPARGAVARGLGRSYGDAAQRAGGTVIGTGALDELGAVAPDGTVRLGAGVDLQRLLTATVAAGWFPPVSPGTRWVTMGGAVAADVHGKNHHADGSFCRHVHSLTLATPTGVHEVTPGERPDLFWATAGGMGLTGVVTGLTLRLLPVESSWMVVDTTRLADLDAVMAEMASADARHRYSVAWLDCGRRQRGRAVLTTGDHAPRHAVPRRRAAFELPRRPRVAVPAGVPRTVVTAATVTPFNEAWFRTAPRRRTGALVPAWSFFHPLDAVAGWNHLYGPAGFVQYQLVVPRGEDLRAAVATVAAAGVPSLLAVLKRFGPGDPGPLSFPMAGWTLAVDFPVGPPALPGLLRRLDELVAAAGGRVYLAKDSRLSPGMARAMYPRLDELAAVCRQVDPDGVLRSDLACRLDLPGGPP